jgi:hypothetical protein
VPTEVPRGECKTVVLSALEEIVREVIEKRENEAQRGGGDSQKEVSGCQEKEGVLREAVRGWLESLEIGD